MTSLQWLTQAIQRFKSFFVSSKWNSFSQNAHNLAVAVSLLAAGLWGIFTFGALEQRNIAIQNAEQLEQQNQALKKQLEENSSSNIDIQVSSNKTSDGSFGLVIDVLLQNNGNKDLKFDLRNDEVQVTKIKYKKDQVAAVDVLRPQYLEHIGNSEANKSEAFQFLYLRPGTQKRLTYFAEVEKESYYYITFQVAVPDNIINEIKSDQPLTWFVSKYFFVGE